MKNLFLLLILAISLPLIAQEAKPMKAGSIPDTVMKNFKIKFQKFHPSHIEWEQNNDMLTAKFKADGKHWEARFRMNDGFLRLYKEEIGKGDLPPEVLEKVKTQYPNGVLLKKTTFKVSEIVTMNFQDSSGKVFQSYDTTETGYEFLIENDGLKIHLGWRPMMEKLLVYE